jgi:hypothetical protein
MATDFEYDRGYDAPPPPLARIPLAKQKGARGGGGGGGGALDDDTLEAGGGDCSNANDSLMAWGHDLVRQLHHHGFAIVELPDHTAAAVARGGEEKGDCSRVPVPRLTGAGMPFDLGRHLLLIQKENW